MISKSDFKKGEEKELLETLGQESDLKAAPWVNEYWKEKEKEQLKIRNIALEMLTGLRKNRIEYTRFLGNVFMMFVKEEDIPRKYHLDLDLNDKGLSVIIKKTKYYGAFTPCGLPVYDFTACKLLAVKLGNTIARLEGYYRSSDGGITLPYKDEEKVYGG